MSKTMYQCKLEREDDKGVVHVQTAWIESKGAFRGKSVELLPSGEFWEVVEVGNAMSEDVVKETQRQRRKPPPSIRDTKKDKKQQEQS